MSALDTQVGGDHYKKLKIQPVEYMHANGIPFIEGCIIKYASRWRDKGGIADLEKIKHFAQLLIDLETAEIKGVEPAQAQEPSHIISDIPDVEIDRLQWKVGDIFEITSSGYEFNVGDRVRLINDMTKERSPCCEYLDGRDHWWVNENSLKFISRPTSTTK